MPALTIRINNEWFAMSAGTVAKATSKTTARALLATHVKPAATPAATEAAWVPVMRISEQIRYEAAQSTLEAQAAKHVSFAPLV